MSKKLLDSLDYASKLSRAPEHIQGLMKDGDKQARKLLASLDQPAYTLAEAARILTTPQN